MRRTVPFEISNALDSANKPPVISQTGMRTGTTNKDLTLHKGAYAAITEVTVPKGSRVTFENQTWYVHPTTFPANSIDRHDATHYGIHVKEEDVTPDLDEGFYE